MDQDSGGKPHVTIGAMPSPEDRVSDLWVLVCVMPDGGEGIYGQSVPGFGMMNFIAAAPDVKDAMEQFIREAGSVEVCRRQNRRLEWRKTTVPPEGEVIT